MKNGNFWLTMMWISVRFCSYAVDPNFVFIIADDLGRYSIEFENSEIKSPAIDNLASSGLLLEEFYVYQYCSPTRFNALNCTRQHLHRELFCVQSSFPYRSVPLES